MAHRQAALDLMEQAWLGRAAARRVAGIARRQPRSKSIMSKSVRYSEAAIALYESIGCFDEAALLHIRLGDNLRACRANR